MTVAYRLRAGAKAGWVRLLILIGSAIRKLELGQTLGSERSRGLRGVTDQAGTERLRDM